VGGAEESLIDRAVQFLFGSDIAASAQIVDKKALTAARISSTRARRIGGG